MRPRPIPIELVFRGFEHHDFHIAGDRLVLDSVPIWFAMLPCLIAPLLWLRNHRRQRTVATGFTADAD